MRIVRFVVHSIVNIRTLVIEELCKRHHRCILKIFPETPSNQMGMQPNDVFSSDSSSFKELRVIFQNFDQLITIFLEFLSLTHYVPIEMLVLKQLHFLLVPENCIVNILWQISNQIEPPWFFAFLIFVEEISEEYSIFPVPCEPFCEKARILNKDS